MKRLPQQQIDAVAAGIIRNLICRYGEKNFGRVMKAIRKAGREQKAKVTQ